MKQFKQRFLLCLVATLAVACSHLDEAQLVDQGGSGKVTTTQVNRPVIPDAPALKGVVSIRIGRYADTRMMGNPRKVGTAKVNGFGMSGKDIILDEDAVTMVTSALKKRLQETGFKFAEEQSSSALFELSGVVKELQYSVKARDEVSIIVETTLESLVTGRVMWSGLVVEKNDNFAGIPRVHKDDISSFLNTELDIVAAKTIASITDGLMISNPELFIPPTTIKPIPGVTILVAPVAPAAPAPVAVVDDNAIRETTPPPIYKPSAKATSGVLEIKTKPARAKVYIDGVYQGLTPFYQEMEGGLYTVSLKVEGYQMMTEKVSVRKKNVTEMDLTLER